MLSDLRLRIRENMLADEASRLRSLVGMAELDQTGRRAISERAVRLVKAVRREAPGIMESFLAEYGLSTREGVALMCLAEALLRVPDAETIDDLIADKITPHDWGAHLGKAGSTLVNASTWALMLTGRTLNEADEASMTGVMHGLVQRLGEPVIRTAVAQAMRELGAQFVLGRTIKEALNRGRGLADKGYTYSYDMLGESAWTAADAERYFRSYAHAIAAVSVSGKAGDMRDRPGISVKLSALHPRYQFSQRERCVPELAERLRELCRAAKAGGISLNIDAEEMDRLDLSLDIVEAVLSDPGLADWDGFGVVVQTYGKRAPEVIDWLYALAKSHDRCITVRLAKGAYWDTEIKRAQVQGLAGFPVFTRKSHSDISYIACARKLLAMTDRIYAQFATHNAHTAAAILQIGADRDSFEFQRLHGMGEALHAVLKREENTRCRIYAPVGAHRDLLAYLVRRLLENGANSSFVHQIVNANIAPEQIARDPFEELEATGGSSDSGITLSADIFAPGRVNSRGIDLTDPEDFAQLDTARAAFDDKTWSAEPMSTLDLPALAPVAVRNPARLKDKVGTVRFAAPEAAGAAFGVAVAAAPDWAALPVSGRAEMLEKASALYEQHAAELIAMMSREAGKAIADGVGEVREAVDFLRYYASEARRLPRDVKPRGVFVAISPWNFPLAIFTGQIAAALVTGNAVIAKPAEQTPLVAARAVTLLHAAGIPKDVLQLLPGDGPGVGASLVADPRVGGVCFTGSTEVARLIDAQLACTAPAATLIAETGGINAMIVDSTALPEQVVRDVLASAFQSAGQRCSALRMLYVQRDVEKRILSMIEDAMDELAIGDPALLKTDIGPLIDAEAQADIAAYCEKMERAGHLAKKLAAPAGGHFLAPRIFRVSGIAEVEREVFGPVLHVASYAAEDFDAVIDAINAKGFGLTFSIHSRVDERVDRAVSRIHAGNVYVNRNQIGAVVGAQPFGGEGLSGTGPKAGGPHYLLRFVATGTTDAAPPGPRKANITTAEVETAISKLTREHLQTELDHQRADDAIALPGPTGESNRLSLMPRGTVLCLGPDEAALRMQVALALAAGNSVVAVAPGAPTTLSAWDWPHMPFLAIDASLPAESLTTLPINAIAYSSSGPDLAALRMALSARNGPIVPLVTDAAHLSDFALERTVSIDTTAAGGNIDLLGRNQG